MPDQNRSARSEPRDDLGDIPGEVTQADIFHRTSAAPDPTRLWAQHAVTGSRKAARHLIVILRVTRKGRQKDDGRAVAVNDDVNLDVAVSDELAEMRGGGLAGWQHDHEPEQRWQKF
jgi:hypothetical protein